MAISTQIQILIQKYKTCLVPGVVAVEKPTQVSCINTEPNFSHTKRTPQTNKSMRKGKSNKNMIDIHFGTKPELCPLRKGKRFQKGKTTCHH